MGGIRVATVVSVATEVTMSSTADPRQSRNVEVGPLHEAAAKQPENAGFPVDHSREAKGMAALHRRGFTTEFVVEDGRLRVAGTDTRFDPEDLVIRDYYRFEGTSDPDDMSVIYAIEARDGTRGTLTDAFGAYADPRVGAVVERMRVEPFGTQRRWARTLIPAALGALTAAAVITIARRRAA
jgi:hypothetical protein